MVVVVVAEDLARTGRVVDTLVGVLVIDVPTNVVNAVAIALEFAGVAVSCSVDALSDGAVDLLMDMSADVLTVIVSGGPPGIGVDVFAVPAPLEGFSCSSECDCRPVAALDCDRALHTLMPSYHV